MRPAYAPPLISDTKTPYPDFPFCYCSFRIAIGSYPTRPIRRCRKRECDQHQGAFHATYPRILDKGFFRWALS